MKVTLAKPVQYELPLDNFLLPLNELTGQTITFQFSGAIHCIHCQRKTSKSFNQGYCFPCFKKLAACDSCIMSPEKCHYHLDTCREPLWGEQFCMTDHIVYLANSTGVKVGITRISQVPVRWIDQGAVQALPIFRVATRQLSGFVEHLFRTQVKDKTNWRALLKGNPEPVDLIAERDRLFNTLKSDIETLQNQHGIQAIVPVSDSDPITINYPVSRFPVKVTTHNFDKNPTVSGVLLGIKGQYLILDTGVLNIRKFTAYHVSFSVS